MRKSTNCIKTHAKLTILRKVNIRNASEVEKVEKLVELAKVQPSIYNCTRVDHLDTLKIYNIWSGLKGKQMAKPGLSFFVSAVTYII